MSQTYKKSGVDIDTGDRFVDMIAPSAKATYRKEVLGGVGPFAASFAIDLKKYKEPVLVSSTDGVGTKLKIAIELGKYDTIGQDLVAMCVNDLICCGAEPLFFLDYFAMGKLKPEEHAPIIEGIARACKVCNCSLIGGETAEMPGMYHGNDFDLAGFAVGVVEKSKAINGDKIKPGDAMIGVASSGIHSNGYSLVRKIFDDAKLDFKTPTPSPQPSPPRGEGGKTLGDVLLEPTKLYSPLIQSLLTNNERPACRQARRTTIHGIAHITGGGLPGNIPRILPENCQAVVKMDSWPRPALFKMLKEKGRVDEEEMMRVFNLGIGLVLVAPASLASAVLKEISDLGEKAWVIGEIKERGKGEGEILFKM